MMACEHLNLSRRFVEDEPDAGVDPLGSYYQCLLCGDAFQVTLKPYVLKVRRGRPPAAVDPGDFGNATG
jgi:hypothetical protein